MTAIRISWDDQADLKRIINRGGPRILIGQLVAYRPAVEANPQLFEIDSYDRHSDTFVLQHPVTRVKLRARALPSDLHIGEGSREENNTILELLRGVGINPAPYICRRPADRLFRPPSPRSPDRGRGGPRRAPPTSPACGFPPAAPFVTRPGGPPPAMAPASLMRAPLAGPRGSGPMGQEGIPHPPGFGPMPPWGTLYHPPRFLSGPPPYPPLPPGPPSASPVPPFPASGSAVPDPSLAELRSAVERLQAETQEIRSGGSGSRTDLSAYAVAHLRKLHSSMCQPVTRRAFTRR
jgi:hypothetical protein